MIPYDANPCALELYMSVGVVTQLPVNRQEFEMILCAERPLEFIRQGWWEVCHTSWYGIVSDKGDLAH